MYSPKESFVYMSTGGFWFFVGGNHDLELVENIGTNAAPLLILTCLKPHTNRHLGTERIMFLLKDLRIYGRESLF